jgi:hypothetical protein
MSILFLAGALGFVGFMLMFWCLLEVIPDYGGPARKPLIDPVHLLYAAVGCEAMAVILFFLAAFR